jgi:hypothetical protein
MSYIIHSLLSIVSYVWTFILYFLSSEKIVEKNTICLELNIENNFKKALDILEEKRQQSLISHIKNNDNHITLIMNKINDLQKINNYNKIAIEKLQKFLNGHPVEIDDHFGFLLNYHFVCFLKYEYENNLEEIKKKFNKK